MQVPQPLPFAGTVSNPAGSTILYCNGINNSPEEALDSAADLSTIHHDRRVYVFHNPSTTEIFYEKVNYKGPSEDTLAEKLMHILQRFITESQNNPKISEDDIQITLYAHSHGACITKLALRKLHRLHPTSNGFMVVKAFGGASMIPRSLAYSVSNFVYDHDLPSHFGSGLKDRQHVLYQREKIIQTAEEIRKKSGKADEEKIMQEAIIRIAARLLHNKLRDTSPLHSIEERSRLCRQNFEKDDRAAMIAHPYYQKVCEEYNANLRDYNIYILPSETKYKDLRTESFGKFLLNIGSNLLKLGADAYIHHSFKMYLPIAKEVLELEERPVTN